ncbi:hypothetical protein MNBD_GAMMA21-1886 [hydrothermal vent metagenome]|uniref:PilZ domain-containing protein n=1 Tax=hydrothermal vent metagenome TaxID=652676 RepID=A0A3B0ZZZ7_9ZZZZ
MTHQDSQRRHFTRIPFDAEYKLHTADSSKHWQGIILDLSLHGVLVQRPEDIQASRGDEFILDLILNANDVNIQMEVHVAHSHDTFIGFECKHIDLDSMTHLRRVLELNLGDPMLLERELNEMIHLKE